MTEVRRAVAADVPMLARLERDLFGEGAWSAAQVREELGAAGRVLLVATEEDRAVGYAVVLHAGDLADLARIGVALTAQRRGVASALLEEARRGARGVGADRMLLEVSTGNPGALSFYAAAGFVEIDRRLSYYRDGSDAVVMRASLGAAARRGGDD